MKKKELIQKLNINLFPEESTSESKYKEARAKYIADHERYMPGMGFFSIGRYVKDPVGGEAEWNKLYPSGHESWRNKQWNLTATGEQNIIDKVNEIVDFINKK